MHMYMLELKPGSLDQSSHSESKVCLCSISKLYVQDSCINKRDNELGIGSVQVPSCHAVHDTSSTTCESVFTDGTPAFTYCGLTQQTQCFGDTL